MVMISIPINNINKVLKVADSATPHRIKNINAKYSATWLPTFSMSRPLSRKNMSVDPSATARKDKLKLFVITISITLISKNERPVLSSIALAINMISMPTIAMYLGTVLLLRKAPANIITIPQMAENIIAFIINSKFPYLTFNNVMAELLVRSNIGCGYTPRIKMIITIQPSTILSLKEMSVIFSVAGTVTP